jgi:UDP-glucose 4-epimerase
VNNRAVIFGGLGFIGHNLAQQLIDLGYDVLVIDAYKSYNPRDLYFKRMEKIPQAKIIGNEIETLDDSVLWELTQFQPTVAYHLANFPNNKLVYNYPHEALTNFSNGLYNVLSHCAKSKVQKFVYVSSSMVYGDFTVNPQSEQMPKKPKGLYGIYKRAAELTTKDFCNLNNIDWRIARPSAVYGPLDNHDRVVGKFLHNAHNNIPLLLKGNEELDFTYVSDTAYGIMLSGIQDTDEKVFNISRGKARSLADLAKIVIEVVGKGSIVETDRDMSYPSRGQLDISQAKHYLNYNPKIDLEEGVQKYYKWYLNNLPKL